jgi:hypothetical protein
MSDNDQPKPEDVRRMNEIDEQLGIFLRDLESRQKTEAAIYAGALLRHARRFYEMYPDKVRDFLLEGACFYMTRVDVEAEKRAEKFGLNLVDGPQRNQ